MSPGQAGAYYAIGVAQLLMGEPEEALHAIQLESTDWYRLTGLVLVYHALGRTDESDAALQELIENHERGWSYQIAYALAYRGESGPGLRLARTGGGVQRSGSGRDLEAESVLEPVTTIRAGYRILESIGKSPAQLAAIEFEVRLPEQD